MKLNLLLKKRMSSLFFLFITCFLGLVNCVPPLQPKSTRPTNLFHRHARIPHQVATYRLPTNIQPLHYTLNIRPILDDNDSNQFTAPGNVTISILCQETTNTITMHSIQIAIDEPSVKVTDGDSGEEILKAGPGQLNPGDETYTITLATGLQPGKVYNLFISFTTTVANNLRGMYRSSYVDSGGNTRWLATTQFQDIDARRAFPCFDEPALKATFGINVGYNAAAGYHVLCNMDEVGNFDDPALPGWKWSEFRTTVKMPTYLVAIIVSDFISESAPPGSFGEKPVKTWGQPDLMEESSGAYSALTTAKDLSFFQEYFNATYELPKMDSVAVPDMYGAMENWGLITYRIEYLLYFNGESTEDDRKWISVFISHEVAHQWLGNIVTMQDWNDIWLNEGFATYFELVGSSLSDPEFDTVNTRALDYMQTAMEYDVSYSTQPLSTDGSPATIIYEKGGCIVRMMEAFLTPPTFRKGMGNYIEEKKYGNAAQDDLFRILNEAAQEDENLEGVTVKEIMDTWTLQTGYPLIKIIKASSNIVYIAQERFKYLTLISYLDPNDLWWVPITYTTPGEPSLPDHNPKLWLPKNVIVTSHIVDLDLNSEWIFLNPDGTGYYRVLYDASLTNLLKSQLERNATVFSSTSRSKLIDDYFTLAWNDYIRIDDALELIKYLEQEDSSSVWNTILNHLRFAHQKLSGTESDFNALANFFSEKLAKALERIGSEQSAGEKGENVILRATLLDWACGMNVDSCKQYASKLYSEWIESPEINPIPVDVQGIMPCAGVYLGGSAEMEFAKTQFINSNGNSEERRMWLNTMTCSSNLTELNALLASAFADENLFTKNEATVFMRQLAENSASRILVFDFLEEQLGNIIAYLDGNVLITRDLFQIWAKYFNRIEHVTRMNEFVDRNSDEYDLPATFLRMHIRSVEYNVEWMGTYGNAMVNWLNNNSI